MRWTASALIGVCVLLWAGQAAAQGGDGSLRGTVKDEQGAVPNAVEAGRQHVEEKPPNEFVRGERHRGRLGVVLSIILIAKPHLSTLDVEQPVVGDGDAVRVATDVVQDLLRSREGRLRVHDPFRASSGREVLEKGRSIAQGFERRAEVESAGVEGLVERLQEAATKQARQDPYRQEETRSTRDPARAVDRETPARDHAVQMGMMPPAPTLP